MFASRAVGHIDSKDINARLDQATELLGSGASRAHRGHDFRTGSHNLVVGVWNSYTSFGGFVAGQANDITGEGASITGGKNNVASGRLSTVSGGHQNDATGTASSVSGGQYRVAPDDLNWAAGELFEPN